MKQNDAVLNLRIATELHDQLKALAQTKYMPLSVMVRLALMEYIKQEAPSALTPQAQPTQHIKRPMTQRELNAMREQQMREPATIRPQSPSTQLSDQQFADDWL